MIKFSKLLESDEKNNLFKVSVTMELLVPGENEGEVGYLTDVLLSSLKYQQNYQINLIETTDIIKD